MITLYNVFWISECASLILQEDAVPCLQTMKWYGYEEMYLDPKVCIGKNA